MNAIENRTKAVKAQEITIRQELDQLADEGITQYEFPHGIILDEVATSLTADGYDVERWFFADPRECFSMVYFDDLANGHLYDFCEDECECCCDCNDDCECGSGCTDDYECGSGCNDTCKCSCGNDNDCECGSSCHDTCKCSCGNDDDCKCGSGCHDTCKCSCGNDDDCKCGSGCHDTCKCSCGTDDDCECGCGCNYDCCDESLYDYLSDAD